MPMGEVRWSHTALLRKESKVLYVSYPGPGFLTRRFSNKTPLYSLGALGPKDICSQEHSHEIFSNVYSGATSV